MCFLFLLSFLTEESFEHASSHALSTYSSKSGQVPMEIEERTASSDEDSWNLVDAESD